MQDRKTLFIQNINRGFHIYDPYILWHYCKNINDTIKNKKLLQFTGSICHAIPLIYNITYNKHKLWSLLNGLLIIASFGNHRYRTRHWLYVDRVLIICNTLLGISLANKLNKLDMILYKMCLIIPLYAYIYGYKTNTLCYSPNYGYLIHFVTLHILTSISSYIVLKNI
jgi:hypothetical protein